ncbi:MAG: NAD(P)/FAD-dependent oxidoreductase [Bacteroidetes bacterium]|nr:NAD(P)/FAD-dependent oxidoreductase [Bacteroidota bacterium]MBS1758036.1 NAD(P)/FAD-dependent oxidoreductase [Bacteroidota bacterium]
METAIIIGAGPAGLTAAHEFLSSTDIIPIILEATADTGGISKTVNYKGNRIDIGGHRFFSKSEKVMNWWLDFLPLETNEDGITISYHSKHTRVKSNHKINANAENVMLVRERLSRIYFLKRFFNYPLKLNSDTIRNLGLVRIGRIGISYIRVRLFPIKKETSLEDFFINRFGNELYKTFFKDYTEKVWGVSCDKISAEWGAQRVKGLSLTKTLWHAFSRKKKNMETSLIEKFLYPKYGPGQLWELVAKDIEKKGGKIFYNKKVSRINVENNKIISVVCIGENGKEEEFKGDNFISGMPIKDLINGLNCTVPDAVLSVSNGLMYRDFITVGILVKKLKIKNPDGSPVKDNWMYIQEKKVKVGRLQLFNNWSPGMINDPDTSWIGLEYFCNEGDDLWTMEDSALLKFAQKEIDSIGIIDEKDVLDGVVIRMPKTYPSYVGSYNRFDEIKEYVNKFENLFLVGRNGMHKYNNQDHSMLTAMQAVENIKNGIADKENIWSINTEEDYHEEK